MLDCSTDTTGAANLIATADQNYSKFLKNVRALRKYNHMNQSQFSKVLGVTQSFLSRQELGYHPFNEMQCYILHELFNMDYLFDFQNNSIDCLLRQQTKQIDNKKTISKYMQEIIQYFNGIDNIPFQNLNENQILEKELLISILNQWSHLGPNFSKLTYLKKALTTPKKNFDLTIGVRSQRFRFIELGFSRTDSKLLFYFYHNCHCKPSYFLDEDPLPTTIYTLLWQLLSKDTREFFINNIQEYLSYEEYSNCRPFS